MADVHHNRERSRFEIDPGNGQMAIADYTRPEGRIMFTHTEVPPDHEGKGLGTSLVQAGLAYAREEGLMVIPICPFFASYMQKRPAVQDLIDPAYRTSLKLRG